MSSDPPSYKLPGSVSRSKSSSDGTRSLADEMLRASLSHGGSPPPSSASVSSTPPSYRRSAVPAFSSPTGPTNPAELLSRARNPGSFHTMSSASTLTVSAADAKARVRNLYLEEERAKAEVPHKKTAGLFKEACATDLLFLIDTTGSMASYIKAAKDQVQSIVKDIKESFLNESEVRVSVVGYKDHADKPNVEFLDFTQSTADVFEFLGRLKASGGADAPEDVLGGIRQVVNASWKQQTRCIIHITDAPPHGSGVLHDLGSGADHYPGPGSEPHHLTYEPLIKQLIQLNINYALLSVNATTDRMAFAFSQLYIAAKGEAKLLPLNKYCAQVKALQSSKSRSGLWSSASTKHSDLQFEELKLGTTYSQLRHLVVRTVTSSVTRTAGRMSMALSSEPTTAGKSTLMASDLFAISEDETGSGFVRDLSLEKDAPKWDTPGWLDETLSVEGFCPDMVLQSANSLNEMMNSDENIKLSVTQLTINMRSKPFAEGSVRLASYARTAASSSKFVTKAFKTAGKMLPHLAEDMRIQALCKAFALEFNGLLNIEPPLDFVVTTCLQTKGKKGSEGECLSLEPYIDGIYIKYNNNSMFVREDLPDDPDQFNQIAQAFSHFTFERSWGHFLVNDLQGVGHLLTDPSIQTLDKNRFKLAVTNLNTEGFKFFFVSHTCNSFCHKLELKSNRDMLFMGKLKFRERWPAIEPTVCCSNKLCRRIIRLASAQESEKFPGHHWCEACWSQLSDSESQWICAAPGPTHEFETSRFFYESQGQLPPRRCPEHVEKDKTVSSAAVVGGSLWSRMKTVAPKRSISGRSW